MFQADLAVSTTWSVARNTLTPAARELFELLSFFSDQPITEDVLVPPGRLAQVPAGVPDLPISRQELYRAERELARFSLVKLNGVQKIVQMHRVVQAVTRGRIEREKPDTATALRETVHALLAASHY